MATGETELSVGQAQRHVLGVLDALEPIAIERVAIEQAGDRVLAAALDASGPLPTEPLSILDGYAVHSVDLHGQPGRELAVVGDSAAGHPWLTSFEAGTCIRISTGAVVPPGADAVVAQEDTRRQADRVEFSATACASISPGDFIRPVGSDLEGGDRLLDSGARLGPGELALLAGCGYTEVPVRARPRVAILASGDELVPIGRALGPSQIVSTNTLMLMVQIAEAGGRAIDLGLVPDRVDRLREAMVRARDESDLLITSGGISVGDHDRVLPVLSELGFQLGFRRIALRPGRPTTFGLLPRENRRPLPVLALPGNPAATLVGFEVLGRPLIHAMLGRPEPRWFRRTERVELASAVQGERRRDHYVRARIDESGRAVGLDRQASGALRSIADFDVLLVVPAGRERVEAGERLTALYLR